MIAWIFALTDRELDVVRTGFDLISTLSILFGGLWAVLQLRILMEDRKEEARERQAEARHKRSEWLWKLSSEFYAKAEFGPLRRELEDPRLKKWQKISPDRFDDFLHYLEMVAVLSDTGQFERKYVNAIFGYWVDRLREKEGVHAYLAGYGYEHLLAWVERRPYTAISKGVVVGYGVTGRVESSDY